MCLEVFIDLFFCQIIYAQQSSNVLHEQGLMKKRACTGSRW